MKKIYLDNNATTLLAPEAFEAMVPLLKGGYGNPSSVHSHGRTARVCLDQAREQVAGLLNAHPGEIIFTSGGTESDNFAISGAALALKEKGRHIITTEVEHPAVLNTCHHLKGLGFDIDILPVDVQGRVDPELVRSRITNETILITIQHANSEIGTLQPIESIGPIARDRGVLFHSDMVQSAGKLPLDVKRLPVDLVSLSAHKMYGPKGVGALYIRKGCANLLPLIYGGAQERNRRGGTENVPGIVGFGAAVEMAGKCIERDADHMEAMRERLRRLLVDNIPGIEIFGDAEMRLPNTLCLGFEGVEGQTLMIRLDIEGISVSTGTACSSGSVSPSPVLSALGVSVERIGSMIRISFGRYNTLDEVERVFETLNRLVIENRKKTTAV